ncbi:MAG TPA: hypothetical protein RMG45_10705 [Polyangiaceae bacterium LLY-WYZ-15_(1-7)]|nr:hypothetical protein [Polyangiaceae bacterium LLY-WYZ-15_(1-7)]HJL27659.1 hypothetical protein [Polyangiaceae bacterium LLY-WYZ-15_(1-7)]HJL46299.1 hypothetical protein [Polyangiaceae bacterium LLY-WYZ-15_(1-7)]
MTRSPNLMSFDGDAARPALALCAALRHLPVVLALGAVACGAAPSSELGRHRIDPAALTDGAWREAPGAGAELRLEHVRDGSVLWVQAVPVPEPLLETAPAVLARSYVDSLAGGRWAIRLGDRGFVSRGQRWNTRLVDQLPARVGGAPAHLVMVDVAGPRLGLAAGARNARAAVAVVRGPSFRTHHSGERRRGWPVLLVVGYAAAPEGFDPDLQDFGALLDALSFTSEPSS